MDAICCKALSKAAQLKYMILNPESEVLETLAKSILLAARTAPKETKKVQALPMFLKEMLQISETPGLQLLLVSRPVEQQALTAAPAALNPVQKC